MKLETLSKYKKRMVFMRVRLLRGYIQKHYKRNISHNKIHQHLLEVGLARHNLKKQKKRKRCRYERKHSLSLVHADWLDYDGTQVIAYEDDTSRKILSLVNLPIQPLFFIPFGTPRSFYR